MLAGQLDGDDRYEDEKSPPFKTGAEEPHADVIEPEAEAFFALERRVVELDKALRQLTTEAHHLGSSIGILSTTFRVCERLARVHFLFRQNAAALFPGKIRANPVEFSFDRNDFRGDKRQRKFKLSRTRIRLANKPARMKLSAPLEPRALPSELASFAKDLAALLDCFVSFQDLVDELPEQTLERDLQHWAEILDKYRDDIDTPAIRRYIHDLSMPLGVRLEHIQDFIPTFTETRIKAVLRAQKQSAGNYYNLMTVATLFSGVAATMIQFSYQNTSSIKANVVNGFWFTSLVFSISAVVHSLLGLTWMQAVYRSPEQQVPWWILLWIKRSPLGFLVLSVLCFFIGLIAFVWSSQQNLTVCINIAVLSATCCFGLTALSLWFALERFIFDWHGGHKLLSDAIRDTSQDLWSAGIRLMSRIIAQVQEAFALGRQVGRAVWSRTRSAPHETPQGDADSEAQTSELNLELNHPTARRRYTTDSSSSESPPPPITLRGKARFKAIVQVVIELLKPIPEPNHRPPSSRLARRAMSRQTVATLRTLAPVVELTVHDALIRDLQFSPDGKRLATGSWDKRSLLLDVKNDFRTDRILLYRSGFVGQLQWSPNGAHLMTKLYNTIKIWSIGAWSSSMRSFVRSRPIKRVHWLPNSLGVLSVEGNGVVKLDLDGNVKVRHTVENMEINDVAITNDAAWMVCVGHLKFKTRDIVSDDDIRLGTSQIILYHLATATMAKHIPLFHDASYVNLASDNRSVLVNFNDPKVPSQLWTLELSGVEPTIALRHTYVSPPAGPGKMVTPASIFGGEDDLLVLRAEAAGDILIWDRDSAQLLHHIEPLSGIGQLASFAWNSASMDSFMFATGSHDGSIRIWRTQTPPEDSASDEQPQRREES